MATRLFSRLRFAPPEVRVEHRADGSMLLRSPQKLAPYARANGEWLSHWANGAADRVFLAERSGEGWRKVTYREALEAVRRIGAALLERRLDASKPVALLSDNSIDHALIALGAMYVGVPAAPISPAYSLMSKDYAKLRAIFELIEPGIVWAADERFAPALAALGRRAVSIAELLEGKPDARVDDAFARVGPDTVAKILFTSGSTGMPKGVINTQRMMCSNQQSWAQCWPFVDERAPVICEWLPWSHTFGGNGTFNMVLRNGGSFYIDGGKPAPGLIETTVRNLKEVSPTMYLNVPRGFDLLLPFLESDAALRSSFFRDLGVIFYAGAALPQNLWERIERLVVSEKDGEMAMLSGWGSTETAPMATCVHFTAERAGVIGLPAPGCEVKLVPSAGKLEARIRGPNVTPGYYRREDLTRAAFDEEGFYRIGDALRLADRERPELGLVFDGRVAEDFKLTSGTWVHVGAVRVKLIAAGNPVIQDAVLTGHDRDEVGALVFLNPAATKGMAPEAVRAKVAGALAAMSAESGSSMHPTRAILISEPPSIDANEITDKGYINQRAVLERRAALVERLYAAPSLPEVVTAAG